MQSPLRLYSASRTFTSKLDTKPSLFISKKAKISKKQKEIDHLNEQLILTKQEKNSFVEENKALRQQIQHLEKQLSKQEKILLMNRQLNNESKHSQSELRLKTEEACSIIAYQKQIKEYELLNKCNLEQIEELKRDTRRTKLQEAQIECKVAREEYDKLNIKYQALMNQIQFSRKEELLKDNMKLSQQLLQCSQAQTILQQNYKKLQHELHLSELKRIKNEKTIQEKEKELQLIQFEYSNPKKTISDLNKQWQIRLENQKLLYMQLEEEIKLKQEKVNLMEKTLKEEKAAFQVKEAYYKREIDSLNIQIGQLKETVQHLEKEQMIEQNSEEQESESDNSAQPSSQNVKSKSQLLLSKKKIQKVTFHEVEIIGKELALKLQVAQIPFSRLDSYIYSKSQRGIINLMEINDILKQSPFELPDDQSLLVARFLAEPEQEEWIFYDNMQTNDVVVVISILRNLIKPYELINPQDYQQLFQQIVGIIKQNKNKLTDYLMLNGDYCDLHYFRKAFDYCDIHITSEQDNFISLKIYDRFKRITNLRFQDIIDYFK